MATLLPRIRHGKYLSLPCSCHPYEGLRPVLENQEYSCFIHTRCPRLECCPGACSTDLVHHGQPSSDQQVRPAVTCTDMPRAAKVVWSTRSALTGFKGAQVMPEVLLPLSLYEISPFCKSLRPPPPGYTTAILSLLEKLNASFNQLSEPGGREMDSASLCCR